MLLIEREDVRQAVVPDPELGVIEEARRHQLRRRAGLAATALLAASAFAVFMLLTSRYPAGRPPRGVGSRQPQSAGAFQSPQQVFAREPGMGVACPRAPNSIACDRVMFVITLRRPAVAAVASVGGRWFRLDDPAWSSLARNGRRRTFAGALQPAGLINGPLRVQPDRGRYYWIGTHPVFARVRVVVHYGHRETIETATRVQLAPGFG